MTMGTALKILAVDDEPSIMQSMRFIFAAPRYELTGAEDGEHALARLDENKNAYDVIITDQKMPHLSGIELVRELRKRNFAGKIMILSANLSPEIREAYEEMDVDVMLDKPFNVRELRLALDRLAA
jgi:DNA-binding response OmpR family regulator